MTDFAAHNPSFARPAAKGLSVLDRVLLQEIFMYLPVFEIIDESETDRVGGALSFGATCKHIGATLDSCFPRFCRRDFGVPCDRPDHFFPTQLGVKTSATDNGAEISTLPMGRISLSPHAKSVWRGFYTLWRSCACFGAATESEDAIARVHSSRFFQLLAAAWHRIFCFDITHIPEMITFTMETVVQVSESIKSRQNDAHFFAERIINPYLRCALVTLLTIQNGQEINRHPTVRHVYTGYLGQFGGLECYNFRTCLRLMSWREIMFCLQNEVEEGDLNNTYIPFAVCSVEANTRVPLDGCHPIATARNPYKKCYFIDANNGGAINLGIMVRQSNRSQGYKIIKMVTFIPGETAESDYGRPLVTFFEQFADKLDSQFYKVEALLQDDTMMSHFEVQDYFSSNFPPSVLSEMRRINYGISVFPQHGKFVSTAVTKNEHFPKGILVTAHTLPVYGTQFGWTYSIRIKVVEDAGNTNRCQLVTRHWQIGKSDGRNETVSGAGVIGLFPVFHQGGFVNVGSHLKNHLQPSEDNEMFVYQSCTGDRNDTVSFGGFLTFRLVPPSEKLEDHIEYRDEAIEGFAGLGLFDVEVKPFLIGTEKDAVDHGLI